MMFLRRGAGYYFDTGASDLIIRKEVKLQQGDVKGAQIRWVDRSMGGGESVGDVEERGLGFREEMDHDGLVGRDGNLAMGFWVGMQRW